MPETGIGLFPDVGATYFLPRLTGKAGLYLGLTGARIGAADSFYLGLATHVVASDALQALDETLLAADLGGDAHAAIDGILAESAADLGPRPARRASSRDRPLLYRRLGGGDRGQPRGPKARIGRRRHSQRSPRSRRPASRSRTSSSRNTAGGTSRRRWALEYRLAMHCNLGVDFFEGIRAQIVDKDRNPAWRPARLEKVTAAAVDGYFEVPPKGDMTW